MTARYNEVQGLRAVVIGASFAILAAAYLLFRVPGLPPWSIVAVALAVAALSALWADPYYRALGRTQNSQPAQRWDVWWPVAMGVGAGISSGIGYGPAAVPFAFAAGKSLWIAVRDWPTRGYYLIGFAGATSAVAIQLTVRGDYFTTDALPLGCLLIGPAWVIVGALDHRLLMSVMKPAPRAIADQAPSP